MRILELFAGKGGELRRSYIEKRGHSFTTLDINPIFNCDITADIMTIDHLVGYGFDFIWASPPCETWSVSSIGHHWNVDNTPKTEAAADGLKLVQHTLNLLIGSRAKWVIENPRGKLRKMPFMQGFTRQTITYCQYGEHRMKPTDIWYHGFSWEPRPMCKNGDSCHDRAPRGARTGTQGIKTYEDKSIVPLELWKEILDTLEGRNTLRQPTQYQLSLDNCREDRKV